MSVDDGLLHHQWIASARVALRRALSETRHLDAVRLGGADEPGRQLGDLDHIVPSGMPLDSSTWRTASVRCAQGPIYSRRSARASILAHDRDRVMPLLRLLGELQHLGRAGVGGWADAGANAIWFAGSASSGDDDPGRPGQRRIALLRCIGSRLAGGRAARRRNPASTNPAMAMTISTATATLATVREGLRSGGVCRSSMVSRNLFGSRF